MMWLIISAYYMIDAGSVPIRAKARNDGETERRHGIDLKNPFTMSNTTGVPVNHRTLVRRTVSLHL